MYDLNAGAPCARLAKFAFLPAYFFIHGKRMRDGLNEPREDFIGTRVDGISSRSRFAGHRQWIQRQNSVPPDGEK